MAVYDGILYGLVKEGKIARFTRESGVIGKPIAALKEHLKNRYTLLNELSRKAERAGKLDDLAKALVPKKVQQTKKYKKLRNKAYDWFAKSELTGL